MSSESISPPNSVVWKGLYKIWDVLNFSDFGLTFYLSDKEIYFLSLETIIPVHKFLGFVKLIFASLTREVCISMNQQIHCMARVAACACLVCLPGLACLEHPCTQPVCTQPAHHSPFTRLLWWCPLYVMRSSLLHSSLPHDGHHSLPQL